MTPAARCFLEDATKLGATLLLLALGCAHRAAEKAGAAAPSRADLAKVAVVIAPQTVVNDPVLEARGAELRAALARALAEEGFHVGEQPGALLVTTSIDYAPWTSVSAASLYLIVGLKSDGVAVDQVEVQKINEAFPEAAKLPELARALAHSLATSPRLQEFLSPKN